MILDVLSWIFLLLGGAFVIIGAIGMLRLPDVFSRSHAAGMVDTFGAGMIVLGLMLQTGGINLILFKLVLILFFILFTSPAANYALVRAALADGAKPILKEGVDLQSSEKEEGEKSL